MKSSIGLVYYASGNRCSDHALQWMLDDFSAAGINIDRHRHWESSDNEITVIAGLSTYRPIEKVLKDNACRAPSHAESVIIKWCCFGNKKLLVVSGSDARGLMYALSEIGDSARCGGYSAIAKTQDTIESPDLAIRGADRFVMGPRDDDWYYSDDFWYTHLKKLAKCRINRFTLITGNDTWYMTPLYPYILQTPGYENVSVEGQTTERRERTLQVIQFVSKCCADYGIDFILGTWQQLPWTDNQTIRVKNLPTGFAAFTDYVVVSLKELLSVCPHIVGMQFRFNAEAGVNADMPDDILDAAHPLLGALGADSPIEGHHREERNAIKKKSFATAEGFWYRVIDALAECNRPLKLDMRIKGLTDDLIEYGKQSGLDIIIATKFWCEHVGSPYPYSRRRSEEDAAVEKHGEDKDFNATRRYSFDNLLNKPHSYDMLYRLWYGSIVLFLWGDPSYVRRFSSACDATHGTGFTFSEPLTLKGGQAVIPGDAWPLHINEKMKEYAFEDERYWMFYLSFGRVGYSRSTSPEVWRRELKVRFGDAWEAVERVYRFGSLVMPLITTIHFPRHPSQHYWPELFPGNALFRENNFVEYNKEFSYATSKPSDEQLFTSIYNAAVTYLDKGKVNAFHPLVIRDWLDAIARQIDLAVRDAERILRAGHGEWFPTKTDFTMLSLIARYHSWMIAASWHNEIFSARNDIVAGCQAYECLTAARVLWRELSSIGAENYHHNLVFDIGTGMRRNGNWSYWLKGQIDKDVEKLLEKLSEKGVKFTKEGDPANYASLIQGNGCAESFSINIPSAVSANHAVKIEIVVSEITRVTSLIMYYRHMNHREEYLSQNMVRVGNSWECEIPAEYVTNSWDMVVYFVAHTDSVHSIMLPGIYSTNVDFPVYIVKTI